MDVNLKTTESVGLMLDVLNENDKNKNKQKEKGFDLNARNGKDMDNAKNVEKIRYVKGKWLSLWKMQQRIENYDFNKDVQQNKKMRKKGPKNYHCNDCGASFIQNRGK